LRRSHAEFAAAGTIAGDIVVDSTHLSISEVASSIRSGLDQLNPRCAAEDGLRPLLRDVDCVQVPVPDLEAGLAFYRDALGHVLVWRTDTAAGLRLAGSDAELVVQTERPELEPNLSVASADGCRQVRCERRSGCCWTV